LRNIYQGSGIRKKTIVTEVSAQSPTKEVVMVGYKYDKLMNAYQAAAKLHNQSGWGLSERDLDENRRSLRGKNQIYSFKIHKNIIQRFNNLVKKV